MRSWFFAVTLALAVLAAGCRSQDGEPWAIKQLGTDGAEAIRAQAAALTVHGKGDLPALPPAGAPAAPYLPRPFVVLSIVGAQEERLVYDAMNRELNPTLQGAGSVRGIVVLDKQLVSERVRRGSKGHAEYLVSLIDRSTKTVTTARADRPEALAALLESLPSRAP